MAKNESNEMTENKNGYSEPATGGNALTVVRAKVSSSVADDFRSNAERWGVEYGVLLEMAMLQLMRLDKDALRGVHSAVISARSENLFK